MRSQAHSYWLAVVFYVAICLMPAPVFSLDAGFGLPAPQTMAASDSEYFPPTVDTPVSCLGRIAPDSLFPNFNSSLRPMLSTAWNLQPLRPPAARGPPAIGHQRAA